jgi:hypothetical protein
MKTSIEPEDVMTRELGFRFRTTRSLNRENNQDIERKSIKSSLIPEPNNALIL